MSDRTYNALLLLAILVYCLLLRVLLEDALLERVPPIEYCEDACLHCEEGWL